MHYSWDDVNETQQEKAKPCRIICSHQRAADLICLHQPGPLLSTYLFIHNKTKPSTSKFALDNK